MPAIQVGALLVYRGPGLQKGLEGLWASFTICEVIVLLCRVLCGPYIFTSLVLIGVGPWLGVAANRPPGRLGSWHIPSAV